MENRERICRFCFEKCDTNFKAIEKNTHEILSTLLVTMNLAISDEPVMCTNCSEILQNCFVFKKTCLDLRDHSIACDNKKNDHAVCEFCMNLLKNCPFTIPEEDIISLKTMLEKYFPELGLSASEKPVICEDCHGSLTNFFTFTTTSSIVEERIKGYCAAEGVNTRDTIKLNDVINFTCENVWRENDVLKIEDTISDESENEEMKIQGICTLCLEKCEIFKAINGNTKDILDMLLPKIDFNIIQQLVICKNCKEVLIKCFDFKTKCLQTQNFVIPFLNNKNDIKLDLKDVYRSRNVTGAGVPEDQEVCGFCLDLVKNSSAVYLDVEEGDVTLKKMVEQCLPELDLNILKKSVICTSCRESLKDCFHFVMRCSTVGEKIKKFCETSNINSKDRVEFSSSVWFTIKDVMTNEVDNDLADKIKAEQLCEDIKNPNEREIGDGEDTVNLLGSIKIEEIFCEKNETNHKEDNLLEMEDKKFSLNEEIEIKTEEHDLNSFEDGIALSQSEATRRLSKLEKCATLNLKTNQYIKHMLTKRPTMKINMYQCALCSYQTKHKSDIRNHFLVHNEPSEVTMYKSDSCSFQTIHEDNLKNHLLVHLEVTMYKCDFCLYQAKRKNDIERHLLTHKNPSEVAMHKCDHCSFQSRHKCSLTRHLVMHKDPSEITVYKCDTCTFQTKQKGHLKTHLLRHMDPSEVSTYKCNHCLFQSRHKSNLKRHMLIHKEQSKVRVYKCDHCLYQTKLKNNFRKHLILNKNHKVPS